MTTLSIRPSFSAQLSAFVTTFRDFVRVVKAPSAAAARGADAGDVWALYRMNRGADAVSPAVTRRLAAHAKPQ